MRVRLSQRDRNVIVDALHFLSREGYVDMHSQIALSALEERLVQHGARPAIEFTPRRLAVPAFRETNEQRESRVAYMRAMGARWEE